MRRYWDLRVNIDPILTNFEEDRAMADPFPVYNFEIDRMFGVMRSDRQADRQTDRQTDIRTQMQYPHLPFGGEGNKRWEWCK